MAAAVPYVLLFLTVVIGPLQIIWPRLQRRFKGTTLNHWRSEVGSWFVIWALVHVGLVIGWIRGYERALRTRAAFIGIWGITYLAGVLMVIDSLLL